MIRIMLVDDQAIVRTGLRSLLAPEADMAVVGEAADGLEAIAAARTLQPDIILLDVRMPRLDGLAALKPLKEASPRSSVIMVTLYDDTEYLMRAVADGAAGYVLKDASRAALVEAVRVTHEGGGLISPSLMPRLLVEVGRLLEREGPAQLPVGMQPLSERETEVLRFVAEGLTNQEIADKLFLGATTVKTHVQNILIKLGVSDRTQAAVQALRLGLIQ
ncbi:MAG: response regulator transcription factor [Chloroflexi bacterium]|nr:response regulator transcription factor [Chloroflexota bacterium]